MLSSQSSAAVRTQLHEPELLQAVLWDMDGTMVDTEPYWIQAEKDLVASYGKTWSDEQALGLVGLPLSSSASLLQEAGVQMEVPEIIDALISRVIHQCTTSIPWRPGARELLQDLHRHHVPCALVTMSFAPLAQLIADSLPEGYLRFLITGDQVNEGKPHPEAYNKALAKLAGLVPQLDPTRIVAIEDSIPGVRSAVASGVFTIAIPHHVALPSSLGTVQWHTLAGKDTADLEALLGASGMRGGEGS